MGQRFGHQPNKIKTHFSNSKGSATKLNTMDLANSIQLARLNQTGHLERNYEVLFVVLDE